MDLIVIKKVRIFNRFYARQLNVFNRYALGTSYSLVEGRIIGEIGRSEGCTANNIAEYLKMDRSYLSRIITKLEKDNLIVKKISNNDSRKKHLYLTDKGNSLFNELERLSDNQVKEMLHGLEDHQIEGLLECMNFIISALGD